MTYLQNTNWYCKYKTAAIIYAIENGDLENLEKEAGIQDILKNLPIWLVSALIMIMAGSSIQNVIKQKNLNKEKQIILEQTLQDREMVKRVNNLMENIERGKDRYYIEQWEKRPMPTQNALPIPSYLQEKGTPQEQEQKENIEKSQEEFFVNNDVIKAIMDLENAGVRTVRRDGDTGVMQVLPGTWKEMNRLYFGGKYPYAKYQFNKNIQLAIGKKYLEHINDWLLRHKDKWKGNQAFLLFACYNGGIGFVHQSGFNPNVIKRRNPNVFDYALRGCNIIGEDIFPEA